MHELDLIRAATQDVDSARGLLQERTDTLDALIQTALDHAISMARAAEASEPARSGTQRNAGAKLPLLAP
jgi:hypothetical protein